MRLPASPSRTQYAQTCRLMLSCLILALLFITQLSNPISTNIVSAKTTVVGPTLFEQPLSEFKTRRQKLMEKTQDGIVILLGEANDGSLGVDAKFRQKDNFFYLTGSEIPDSVLVLVPQGHKGAKEWLFIPPRNLGEEQWTGPQPGPGDETAKEYGIERVASTLDLDATLTELIGPDSNKSVTIYTVIPPSERSPLIQEQRLVEKIQTKAKGVSIKLRPIADLLSDLRMIKTPAEQAQIQRAIDITAHAHRDVLNNARPGIHEYELEGIILGDFYRGGAQRAAFPCIVGSGFYSTVLHYERNRKKIDDNDLIVVDIGAEYNYYAADITRTYPASGRFTPRQKEIYQLVLEAQTAAANAFKPGKSTIYELQEAARQVMRKSPLRDSKGRTLDYSFIHGLGHFVGLNVHDVGDYSMPLPPGAVITIEPGIYLPDEKLGVRIEDDYLVTNNGLVKMSQNIVSDPDQIEQLMSKRTFK